ncbi:IclR family transcriptional regulator [Anaerolentibacter hominis]|uniref:IclR family transcriptional regulator n=1 Tax=Anaerolentibacter hominis TaxID=3079009 RepID=UPI0031B8863E
MEDKNPIQSAGRIFHVLETLADTGPAGLMELSDFLALNKSTVHRLLASLIYMGYVTQDSGTGKYMLTFKVVELSRKVLARTDILSLAHPRLERLAGECRETVHLVRRSGSNVIYIDKVEPVCVRESAIRMASQVGSLRPLYCSAVGKAILSTLSEPEIRSIWTESHIEKKTEHTITSLPLLLDELNEVRRRGYALDNEENEIGVRCIAASIYDFHGEALYAFSISAPISRMDDARIESLASYVLAAKKELESRMGSDAGHP